MTTHGRAGAGASDRADASTDDNLEPITLSSKIRVCTAGGTRFRKLIVNRARQPKMLVDVLVQSGECCAQTSEESLHSSALVCWLGEITGEPSTREADSDFRIDSCGSSDCGHEWASKSSMFSSSRHQPSF